MQINVKGLNELETKFGTAAYRRAVMGGVRAAALEVKSEVSPYPRQPVGRLQPFKTDKQRRGFFAKLKAGEIEVPYRRGKSPGSENLGQRWTVRSVSWFRSIVGNNASYGELVQGAKQSRFHALTGWRRIDKVVAIAGPKAVRGAQQSIRQWLEG